MEIDSSPHTQKRAREDKGSHDDLSQNGTSNIVQNGSDSERKTKKLRTDTSETSQTTTDQLMTSPNLHMDSEEEIKEKEIKNKEGESEEESEWGKLVSLNPSYSDVILKTSEVTIGRGSTCLVSFPEIPQLSSIHCRLVYHKKQSPNPKNQTIQKKKEKDEPSHKKSQEQQPPPQEQPQEQLQEQLQEQPQELQQPNPQTTDDSNPQTQYYKYPALPQNQLTRTGSRTIQRGTQTNIDLSLIQKEIQTDQNEIKEKEGKEKKEKEEKEKKEKEKKEKEEKEKKEKEKEGKEKEIENIQDKDLQNSIDNETQFQYGSFVLLEDLSTNGTYVNGKLIGKGESLVLKDADEITLIVPSIIAAKKKRNRQGFSLAKSYVAFMFRDKNAQTLEDYDIIKALGEGSFAEVKLGLNKKTSQKVAIKMLDKEKFQSKVTTSKALRSDMFMDEITILKSIDHPNIIKVYDVIFQKNYIYLILEYAPGGDLFDRLIERSRLPEKEAKELFIQMVDAIGYLHERDIAHRDLKLENFLLLDKGNRLKLSDFGFSKIIGPDHNLKTFCGTPEYVAPEILKRKDPTESYTKACDIWSLGVILFVLLGGYTPFEKCDYASIIRGKFSFDDVAWRRVSKNAKDLISSMLTVNVEQRITIEDIKKHPWITEYHAPLSLLVGTGSSSQSTSSPTKPVSPKRKRKLK